MIEIKGVVKNYDEIKALSDVSFEMPEGQVFGLVGTNGAGKSTLLRCICGVCKPDSGEILVDGEPVWENPSVKEKIFFISDDQYYFPGSTPNEMAAYYKTMYPKTFSRERFDSLMDALSLDRKRRIQTFSKGMKKQLSIMLGIASGCKYVLCDETFDGLDPVVRQAVKRLFIHDMEEAGITPVIASHNLRELEDICEYVGLLHKGGVILSKDLGDMKLGIFKVQVVFKDEQSLEAVKQNCNVIAEDHRGSLITLTIRGQRTELDTIITSQVPVFYEVLPLTLEEIFISETEVLGYDFAGITK
ncbi:MAG: ABC transporter ATP-binding protein [Lachnospiraceae bacterium]|nr:ABC transporter ATP-binding protein [Lachnospiraceae bacterium]